MITLTEFKDHAIVHVSDDDLLLQHYLDAAVDYAEGQTGRIIASSSQTKNFSSLCENLILEADVTAITSITYIDEEGVQQTLASTEYVLINDDLIAYVEPAFEVTWPATRSITQAVTVTYDAGYTTVPTALKQAVYMLASGWYENREATIDRNIREVPLGTERILSRYRVHHV